MRPTIRFIVFHHSLLVCLSCFADNFCWSFVIGGGYQCIDSSWGSYLSSKQWDLLSLSYRPLKKSHSRMTLKDDSFEGDGFSTTSSRNIIRQRLKEWFQGDFDNYSQVVKDRKNNLEPREGGGHEHFHCTLVPVSETTRLAAFFFDGNPNRIFRFRYYELDSDDMSYSSVRDEKHSIEMRLSTLHPDLEQLLKSHADEPLRWPDLFDQFQPNDPTENKVTLLPRCEILWSLETDPIQHSYVLDIPEDYQDGNLHRQGGSLHAVMVHGEAIVNSTIVPGMTIRILDQLSLYPDVFYINDRGLDPFTGAYIYGNQCGVPYRLERVSSFLLIPDRENNSLPEQMRRQVINDKLEWTLGPLFRTTEEYERKLNMIGGPSVGINKKHYTNTKA